MEEKETQKEEVRAIVVQGDALQKPLRHGLSITLSYDFVRSFKPEYAGMSDSELKGTLSKMSQEELGDIFAGGVYVMTEATVEKIPAVIPVGDPVQGDPGKDEVEEPPIVAPGGETVEEKPEDKKTEEQEKKPGNKRKWLALLAVIPLVLLLKNCGGPDRAVPDGYVPPEPPPPGVVEIVEDKDIIDELGEIPPIVIHNPTDATQEIKALTDLGNQEHESNVRKEGKTTSGGEMAEKEGKAVEGYEENKAHFVAMTELMQKVNDPSVSPQERMTALLEMQEHAQALYGKYDMEEIKGLQDYSTQEIYAHEDSYSGKEENIAADAVSVYEKNMGTQRSNVEALAYFQYLSEFGYDITAMQTEIQVDGDLVISGIQGQRTIKESQSHLKPVSFEEFKQEVAKAIDEGRSPTQFAKESAYSIIYTMQIGDSVKHGVEGHYDDPIMEEDGLEADKTSGIGTGDKGLTITIGDLQNLAAKRNMNPRNVEAAIKAMTDEMAKLDKGPEIEDGRDA